MSNSGSAGSVSPGWRIKSRADLPAALDVVAVKVNRRRGDRRMSKVVSDGSEVGAVFRGTSGMRMPHPVRARAAQFLGERRVSWLDHLSRLQEEPAHHAPQPCRGRLVRRALCNDSAAQHSCGLAERCPAASRMDAGLFPPAHDSTADCSREGRWSPLAVLIGCTTNKTTPSSQSRVGVMGCVVASGARSRSHVALRHAELIVGMEHPGLREICLDERMRAGIPAACLARDAVHEFRVGEVRRIARAPGMARTVVRHLHDAQPLPARGMKVALHDDRQGTHHVDGLLIAAARPRRRSPPGSSTRRRSCLALSWTCAK
jgi:hypothetical protein